MDGTSPLSECIHKGLHANCRSEIMGKRLLFIACLLVGHTNAFAADPVGLGERIEQFKSSYGRMFCNRMFQFLARPKPDRINTSPDWNSYPKFEADELGFKVISVEDEVNAGMQGKLNAGVGFGKLPSGEDVFVKVISPYWRYSSPEGINEYQWYTFLNELGLGPKIHGVTKFNGRWALVMERVDGVSTKAIRDGQFVPDSFKLTQSMIDDMRQTARILKDAGLRRSFDLQFIFTPDGRAVLIDPQWYFFTPTAARWMASPDPVQENENLIRLLKEKVDYEGM